jgi:gas vesicle protein
MNYQKTKWKSFLGGSVCGLLVGTIVGSVAMLLICGTVFMNYLIKNEKQLPTELYQKSLTR